MGPVGTSTLSTSAIEGNNGLLVVGEKDSWCCLDLRLVLKLRMEDGGATSRATR